MNARFFLSLFTLLFCSIPETLVNDFFKSAMFSRLGQDEWGIPWALRIFSGAQVSLWVCLVGFSLAVGIGFLFSFLMLGFQKLTVFRYFLELLAALQAVPSFLLAGTLLIFFKSMHVFSVSVSVSLALGLSHWFVFFRLGSKGLRDYYASSRALENASLGLSARKVFFGHAASFAWLECSPYFASQASKLILFETLLGFLGIGIKGQQGSLGAVLGDAYPLLMTSPQPFLIAGVALTLVSWLVALLFTSKSMSFLLSRD